MTAKRSRRNDAGAGSAPPREPAAPGADSPPPPSDEAARALAFFREVVEGACDLIYRLDAGWRFLYVNPAAQRLLGLSPANLLGTSLLDLVREDHRMRLADELQRIVSNGAPVEYIEFPIVTASGEERWLGQLTQHLAGAGGPCLIQGEARDVTAERSTREALAVSERRVRAVIECLGEGLIVSDAEDRILYVNPAFERITGYPAEELVGNRAFELLTAPGEDPGAEASRRLGESPERYDLRIRHRKGHWVDLRVLTTPLRDHSDLPFALLSAVTDVSEQKRLERARDESDIRFRQLADNMREAFWIATADLSKALYVSPAYEEIMGSSREALLKGEISLLDCVHVDDRPIVEQMISTDQGRENGLDLEFRVVRPDGEIRWVRNRGFAVRDAEGRIHRLAGVAEDITERRAARELMRTTEVSYRSLYNSLTDLVYIQDLEGRFLNVNDAVLDAYGYTREELLGATPALLADPDRFDPEEMTERVRRAAAGEQQRFEFWGKRKDGTVFPKEVVLSRTEYFGQDALMTVARDISEQKRAQQESERLAALSRENPNPVLECDADGRPVHVNPSAERIARELGLDSVVGLLPPEHASLVAQSLERGDGFQDVEAVAAGRIFEWTYRPHAASGVVHLFAKEVTGRRQVEERLRHHALHDALTDLPNRLMFLERLEHAVQRARRRGEGLFAILFLDLDRFKVVNDSLGHHIGDELLTAVADRLRGSVRTEDTIARLGGDEFAILVENIGDVSDAIRVADRIHEALSEPLHLEGYDVVVSCSVGIALGESAEVLPRDLLRNADVAMYRAKAAGPGRFEVFDPGMHIAALDRLQMESELRAAEERGQLVLYYQPLVELASGSLAGVEALIRWDHPQRGLLLPESFIPLAEETGMVQPIGGWVLRQACTRLAAWRGRFGAAAPRVMAVNVSARQLVDEEVLQQVRSALAASGLPGSALCLEITEGGMMENVEAAAELLQRLKALGVRICVDDFGTGYSSLNYLHRFPLDELKIDRSFVARMTEDHSTLQLVRTMTTLTRSLDARSVAEGVETAEQLELLRGLGINFVQGYLIGRPMGAEALEELIDASTWVESTPSSG